MFTQSFKFSTSHCQKLQSTDASTEWFIKYTENKRLPLSTTFTLKFELVDSKLNRKYRFFKNRHQAFLRWKSPEILNIFIILTLKQTFWKTKKFFQKLDEYCFLVENNEVKNALFPYKTSLLDANVKANRTGSEKWTYNKERGFVCHVDLSAGWCSLSS